MISTSGRRGGRSCRSSLPSPGPKHCPRSSASSSRCWYDLVNPVVVEGEDPEIVRDFLAARDLVAETEAGTASPEDIDIALENLTEIHDYLVADRRPP